MSNILINFRKDQAFFQNLRISPLLLSPKSESLGFDLPEVPSFLSDFSFPCCGETLAKSAESPVSCEHRATVVLSAGSEDVPEPSQSSLRRKRGRKPKVMTVEDKIIGTQRRLERNRVFARENRKKKKEYIAKLEGEVSFIFYTIIDCITEVGAGKFQAKIGGI